MTTGRVNGVHGDLSLRGKVIKKIKHSEYLGCWFNADLYLDKDIMALIECPEEAFHPGNRNLSFAICALLNIKYGPYFSTDVKY